MALQKKDIFEQPAFWFATVFAVFYVLITFIYALIPLAGKIASPLYLLGIASIFGFGPSIVISCVNVFFWKTYKMAYVPFLINALTFGFLCFFWVTNTPYQTRLNDYHAGFWDNTGFELPRDISNAKEFDSGASFLGDGEVEVSFTLSQDVLGDWMQRSGFDWKQGPQHASGNVLNEYKGDDGSLVFLDGPNVKYVVIDRSPKGQILANTTTIYVNETEGWVLEVDYDS